jgi:hypothetical protein
MTYVKINNLETYYEIFITCNLIDVNQEDVEKIMRYF